MSDAVVSVRLLAPQAKLPSYMTEGAAGMDLCAIEELTLAPTERASVGTGIEVAIPAGFEGQIRPRSGLALKKGLTLVNAPGTIDSDYRGELRVLLINLGKEPCLIRVGDRIAQLVISPVIRAEICQVAELSATPRGAGGFGHTGP